MSQPVMQLALDEMGNPFILVRDQEKKQRIKGIDAQRSNIAAAQAIATTMRTSLGPKGMDKIIVSPDGDVTVTNDGATILTKMDISHECGKLLVDLSKSQDSEMGDGTTSVVVFAGALLGEALKLLNKGIHPIRISEGFDLACGKALEGLEKMATEKDIFEDNNKILRLVAETALGSKVLAAHKTSLAEIALKAILSVADLENKKVNFDLIKVEGKAGASMGSSKLVEGIILEKDLSHPQMRKLTTNAKIAILTCPFEPPKPKTKHKLEIHTAEEYKKLQEAESGFFVDMIKSVKASGANFVICQWGFDDEANHLLASNDLPAVRWVGGVEMEMIAIATGGRIVGRFEDLTPEKLGHATSIKEINWGTQNDELIFIEGELCKAVTILLRGSNQMIVEEAKRSIHDALCCIRNLIRDSRVVCGGGAPEIAASIAVEDFSKTISTEDMFAVVGFSDALISIPMALAENSGLEAIPTVANAKAAQIELHNSYIGIDCKGTGEPDMRKQGLFESYLAKKNQIQLANQIVKMILKIDDIIIPAEVNACF